MQIPGQQVRRVERAGRAQGEPRASPGRAQGEPRASPGRAQGEPRANQSVRDRRYNEVRRPGRAGERAPVG